MPLITTARTPIWVADGRNPDLDEPIVVLIHGAAGSRLDWSGEMRGLHNVGVIAIDLPGHGKSPQPGRTSVADYAADVVALLDALRIKRAVFIGHSMGGAVAQTLALDHAERVQGIALIATGAKLPIHPDILGYALSDQPRVARQISQWSWANIDDETSVQGSTKSILETPPDVMHGDFMACAAFDSRSRLAEIRVPTLVIGAESDQMMPPKFSQYLHEHIAGSTLVMVANAGHKLILEQPKVVAGAVQNWLDQIIAKT